MLHITDRIYQFHDKNIPYNLKFPSLDDVLGQDEAFCASWLPIEAVSKLSFAGRALQAELASQKVYLEQSEFTPTPQSKDLYSRHSTSTTIICFSRDTRKLCSLNNFL